MVDILESGADADYLPGAETDDREPHRPAHRNIRGKEYFAASIRQSTQNDNVKMETNHKTSPVTPEKDRNSVSTDLVHRMRLHGMAAAFSESLQATFAETMTPDSFLNWLLSREWDYRVARNIERLVKARTSDTTMRRWHRSTTRCRVVRTATGWNVLPRWILSARVTTCSLPAVLKHGQKLPGYSSGYEACKAGVRVLYANASKLMGRSENRQKQRDNRVGTEETRKNAAPNPRRPLSGSPRR